jgi:hypothetical protein
MDNSKKHFILKGFNQVMEFRVFEFEGIAVDAVRASITVRVDLALARKYGIRLQELPLLCKEVLDQCGEGEQNRSFTYSEAQMCTHADDLSARELAAKAKKATRRPAPVHVAAPWGVPTR